MRSSATSNSAVFRVAMACLSTSSRPAAASTSALVTMEHRTLHRILGGRRTAAADPCLYVCTQVVGYCLGS